MSILQRISQQRKRLLRQGKRPRRVIAGPSAYRALLEAAAEDGLLLQLGENLAVMGLNVVRSETEGMRLE